MTQLRHWGCIAAMVLMPVSAPIEAADHRDDQKAYADAMSGLSNQSREFPLRQNPSGHLSENNKHAYALQHRRTIVTLSPISVHVAFSSTRSRSRLVGGARDPRRQKMLRKLTIM